MDGIYNGKTVLVTGGTRLSHHLIDISRARIVLNFKPKITLEQGLRKTFHWMCPNQSAQSQNSFGRISETAV